MDSLIFVGDGRYINQQADSDLRELLDREFPQIDYRFYSAHEMSTEALLDSLNRIDIHRTGILFSSWHYTKKSETTSSPSPTPTASSPACRPRCSR